MNIIVSGGNGQIGSELKAMAPFAQAKVIVLDRDALDITKSKNLRAVFKKFKPSFFINAAAYTKVDLAEDEIQSAYDVNANALIAISDVCNLYDCCLLHYSTDYVYNLNTKQALKETHKTSPKGVYAESKRLGEKNIQALCNKYIILRTSWVYSKYGKNFVDTMLRLSKTHDSLNVVSDQIGSPTHARDIASASIRIIEQLVAKESFSIQEVYNYSNAGKTNWADFARKIFKLAGISCKIHNISTHSYNAKAHRPLWSLLSSAKIRAAYKLDIPLWEDSLNDYLSSTGNIDAQ